MPMGAKNLTAAIFRAKQEIIRKVNDRLPLKIGVITFNHFRQKFRNNGFMEGGNRPCPSINGEE